MPVRKASLTRLKKTGSTFVTIPSSTLALIQNPDSVAILAYLLDRSQDWIVRRDDIMRRFSIGRDRYQKAMNHLKDLGLAWIEQVRDEQGVQRGTQLAISAEPVTHLYREGRKTDISRVSGNSRESDHYDNTDLFTTQQSVSGPTQLPADWYPSADVLKRCEQLGLTGIDYDYHIREFCDYWHTTKKRRKDWDSTFLNRMKAIKQNQDSNHGSKNSSKLLADDLDTVLAK
ncbi:MAG: DnaT-like ssDNA-binding domain-containing protein [Pseudomonadota bacterium]